MYDGCKYGKVTGYGTFWPVEASLWTCDTVVVLIIGRLL